MNSTVDVAIIGAGPYGLSLAAHLENAGVSRRIFGHPMGFWRAHMPDGMLLKSEAFASSLSDPARADSFAAFCQATNRAYVDRGDRVSLGTFVEYGEWFQRAEVPDVEPVLVTDVTRDHGGFEISLVEGDRARARCVVVATGVQHFAHVPRVLTGLPSPAVSHSSDHIDLGVFRGRDVVVVGAGQSALESAALLSERGARVRVMARGPELEWNGEPLLPGRPLARRLREPAAPLGSGWATWFYCNHPALFRYLPTRERIRRARTSLGPAGAWWLRQRVEEGCEVLLGHTTVAAETIDGGVRLRAQTRDARVVDVVAEHVLAATGYRPDIARLPFLGPAVKIQVQTCFGAPKVDAGFESSVPGLHFIGPVVASTFGPAMRFVWGADFAARVLTRRLVAMSVRGRGRVVDGCVGITDPRRTR